MITLWHCIRLKFNLHRDEFQLLLLSSPAVFLMTHAKVPLWSTIAHPLSSDTLSTKHWMLVISTTLTVTLAEYGWMSRSLRLFSGLIWHVVTAAKMRTSCWNKFIPHDVPYLIFNDLISYIILHSKPQLWSIVMYYIYKKLII